MTTKKLLMFAAAGFLLPTAWDGAADAGRVTKTKVIPAPATDLAPVANGRLRRTNEEQAGNEMATFTCDASGKKCLYFAMTTELPGTSTSPASRLAPDRIQGSLVPFELAQDTDGSVIAQVKMDNSRFITNNRGNDYRNFNHPYAFTTGLAGEVACVEYNYQGNDTNNDTRRFIQCYDFTGTELLGKTQVFAKNNDDASMNQAGHPLNIAQVVGTKAFITAWRGANGNGADDGWEQLYSLDFATPGKVQFANLFDVSLCPREERSHGQCSVGTDVNTAICTWTEGNNQPERDGTWMAAVDITPGKFKGANQQGAILWKQQIEGRKDDAYTANGQAVRTYSMRAAHERITTLDTATNKLVNTDMMLWYSNDLRGNNNTNEKGGTIYGTMMGVIKADKTGMSYVMPLQNTATMLKGLGGTHLGMSAAVFGTTDNPQMGAIFTNGSHTGGYFAGQARSLVWDQTANKFIDGGMTGTAENDRHLYSNYLGNNPGNQGRNYAHASTMANPFVNMNGNQDAFLYILASTGKPSEENLEPQKKASAFITIVPVASKPATPAPNPNQDPTNPNPDGSPQEPGDSLGGCSTGGSTGLATFLLIGLAAFGIRRRR